VIEVQVKKKLGAFSLDAAFTCGEGVTALFGRSGAGKSTIVKAVAGLIRPDAGSIRAGATTFFDAERGIDLPSQRREVGVVFQDGRLFPHMTVRRNLMYGFERKRGEKRVTLEAVTGVLGISSMLERRPVSLSGGERQRVAVGRALLSQPRLLLMDEPLASLDEARKAELLPYFEKLNTEFRIPILYVSHAIDEVMRLASDIVLLDQGQVVAAGSLAEVTSRIDLPPAAESFGSGAILECTVESHDASRGLTTLATALGPVKLALIERALGSRLSIRVAARDVALASERPANISVQNIFDGSVAELRALPNHIVRLKIAVRGGFLLSEITADAMARLNLKPGLRVVALVKSVAIGR
jgi:molybdate transport system ATP-binding protein